MSEPAEGRPSTWRWHARWFLIVVTMSVLAWAITQNSVLVLTFLPILTSCTQLIIDRCSTSRPDQPAWSRGSLRFSIGHVMVATGLAAVFFGTLRALFTTYPIEDKGIVLMISGGWLFLYALLCFMAYTVWVRVRNVQAVLRGDRSWQEARGRGREEPTGRQPKE